MTNTRAEQTATAREAETTAGDGRGYQTRPLLKIRRGYTDLLTATKRKNIIHGLVEIDVTKAHRLLRQRESAGEDLSFTLSSSTPSPVRWMRIASCTPTGGAAG
jgi:hypothetical protein